MDQGRTFLEVGSQEATLHVSHPPPRLLPHLTPSGARTSTEGTNQNKSSSLEALKPLQKSIRKKNKKKKQHDVTSETVSDAMTLHVYYKQWRHTRPDLISPEPKYEA